MSEIVYHPKPNDEGRPERLLSPSSEAGLDRLADPGANLVFVPGSVCGEVLNGVALAPCAMAPARELAPDPDSLALAEPPFEPAPGLQPAAGAVVLEPDGRVWLVAPSNGYGGYRISFPKGRVEPGVSLKATAIREAWEETGLRVSLSAWLGDFARTQTCTRFYLARRTGGHPGDMGWESQAVHLATLERAAALLHRDTDRTVLAALLRALGRT